MIEISDIKITPVSRRDFINHLIKWGRLGLLGTAGFNLLSKCTGEAPSADDLDPPYICLTTNSCNSGQGGNYNYTNTSGATVYFVFSGYNSERNFSGYNIWYGTQSAISSDHSSKARSTVISQTGSSTLSVSSLGGTKPSYVTSATVNSTVFVTLTINNVTTGNYLYITAYSSTDNLDSPLSNGYLI